MPSDLDFSTHTHDSSEINEVTEEQSETTSQNMNQQFESYHPDNLPGVTTFLDEQETNEQDIILLKK